MRRIYQFLVRRVKEGVYWFIDYVYVVYWQIKGAVWSYDISAYTRVVDTARPPIILLPGIYEKWHFMKPVADVLRQHGFAVHVIEGLGYNTGSIEVMAQVVERYVQEKQLRTYSIVAHSKGGLIAKYLLTHRSSKTTPIQKVITLNTPFGGSKYAKFFPLRSIRMFLPTSPILLSLAKEKMMNARIVSIYGQFDPHIPEGSYLVGAKNIQLRTYGHFRIMSSALVHREIIKNLLAV